MRENVSGVDRSRFDPDVKKGLKEVRRRQAVDRLFPQRRVEDLALETRTELNNMELSLSTRELNKVPIEEDVLVNMYKSNLFITNKIVPVVYDLLERTGQTVYLTDFEMVGYSFVFPDEDYQSQGDEPGICLVINDRLNDNFITLETTKEIQEAWDTSDKRVRDDLKAFASLSKREILDKFFDFIDEYVCP